MAKDTSAVQLYYEAVNELLGGIAVTEGFIDEVLRALMEDRSESARLKEKGLYEVKLGLARDRLERLLSIKPPKEARAIHGAYFAAFEMGVEARQQALDGNYPEASAAYEVSSKGLTRANSMWDELGVKKNPEL